MQQQTVAAVIVLQLLALFVVACLTLSCVATAGPKLHTVVVVEELVFAIGMGRAAYPAAAILNCSLLLLHTACYTACCHCIMLAVRTYSSTA